MTAKDGLVFFSDEALFVERGVGLVGLPPGRFDVALAGDAGVLRLVDRVRREGRTFAIEIRVPEGWTDADTLRIRERLR